MSISPVDRSLTAALNQIYGTTGPSGASQDTNEATSTEDSAAISAQALQLSSLFGTQPGQAITLDDVQTFAREKLKEFQERFKALLEANGIDTSQPITLGHEYGSGRLKVTNGHPDAQRIEKLLAEDSDLSNTYTSATSALEIARHGEEHGRFADAYESNPMAAVAQFSYLFNSQWDARVTFQRDAFDVSYDRIPRVSSTTD
jgi:hypothetical protein